MQLLANVFSFLQRGLKVMFPLAQRFLHLFAGCNIRSSAYQLNSPAVFIQQRTLHGL